MRSFVNADNKTILLATRAKRDGRFTDVVSNQAPRHVKTKLQKNYAGSFDEKGTLTTALSDHF